MGFSVGGIEDSYYYPTVKDRTRRFLAGEIALPLPSLNLKEVPCVVRNRTPDIFGTEEEEWSDLDESEEETGGSCA